MERQKFRIKRKNSQFYGTPTCSTTGTTGLWPLNLSVPTVSGQTTACNNVLMYNSLGSQVVSALNGDMTTFPEELRDCSQTNPCAILWDEISPPFNNPSQCKDDNGNSWVQFKGLQYWSAGTPTIGTYNELIDIYQIYNADPTLNILGQLGGWFTPQLTPCFCENTFAGQDLSAVDVFLTQDFNDIGHYSIWDGNISQKDVMSNFLFTSFTQYSVQVFNTTDFEFYKNLPSDFTIDWGDGNTSTLVGGSLTAVHNYPMVPFTYLVTITQQTPWGPQSTSKSLTVPNLNYLDILGEAYTPGGVGTGYGTGGLQAPQNQTSVTGPPIYDNNPTSPTFGQFLGNEGGATGYFGAYGQEGTDNYLPLDTGIDILQYTGMSPTPCFEVSGITESSIGAFQTYSNAPSNDPNLPPGYFINTVTPIGGDVENPLTNTLETQLEGIIFYATTTVTGYTIQSTTQSSYSTPIDFYDFNNGVTVFIAQSCGLNANSFGGEDCYKCPIESCIYCEEKDEYIDRVTLTPYLIEFDPMINTNYAALGQPWSPNVDYKKGDIVFDITANLCCCFMAVVDINQSNPSFSSPWVAVPPALTNNGVWTDPDPNGLGQVHVWETCCYYPDCDCAPCPTGTLVPCNDPTLPAVFGGPNSNNGGVWQNGFNYTAGQFISDTHGNCYKALQSGLLGEPTGFTANLEWEYTGCISWICPTDPINIGIYGCEPVSSNTLTVINQYFPSPGMVFVGNAFYDSCLQDFNDGLCPYPERWKCDDQYSCGACIPIYPGDPDYGHPGYPFNFVFSSQTDCNDWCNPPLYSCATPTNPCCTTISCMNQALYFSLTSMIPNGMSAANVLINFNLYQAPTYTLADCQQDCCVETYEWDCEQGCQMTPFSVIPANSLGVGPVGGPQTLADCQALNNGGLPGQFQNPPVACGWSCTTPTAVYNPMPQDPFGLGYYSSPCTPCYTNNCAPYPNELSCISGCTQYNTCYVCDCTTAQGWYSVTPCPTPIAPGSNIFGANNGVASDASGLLTYDSPAAIMSADCCDEGWDCWVISDPNDPNFGQPDGNGCTYYANHTMIPGYLSASTNGPYSSHTQCCIETNCCYAECDWALALTTTYSNLPQPNGFYPCVYLSAMTSTFLNCHPNNPAPASNSNPYCSIQDCYTDTNPTDDRDVKCDEDVDANCDCCSAYTWTNYGMVQPLIHMGTFTYPGVGYPLYSTVTHFDADSPECCYICMCPNLGFGAAGINGILDCDGFIPDDGPSPTGQPNCWESCTFKSTMPSPFNVDITYDASGNVVNVSPAHCPTCDPAYSAQTYQCVDAGCQPSACVINPVFSMTSQNCYDNMDCIGVSGLKECEAGCYCIEGPAGSPSAPWNSTGCVVLQDHLNQTDNIHAGGYPSYPPFIPAAGYPNNILPLPYGTYPYASLSVCLTLLNSPGPNTPRLDCCDDPRYYCDNLWSCGQLTTGQGCQTIYPGDPNYNIAPFITLQDCLDYCTWECDSAGLGQCQFVPNSIAVTTYPTGPACEAANVNCDCRPVVQKEYWCDDSGLVGITPNSSNCVSNTLGTPPPNPANSWGLLAPGFTQPCLYGTPNCYSFGTLGLCEQHCRFCCDVAPPGTSFCQLDWLNPACDVSLYDCTQTSITVYGAYPCLGRPDVEFCCEPIQGCQSYIVGNPPAGCFGNYASMADCQIECNFLCDPCVPTCECVFTGPIPSQCNPATVTAYSSLTQCQNIVSTLPVIYGGKGCCDCWECFDQGGVYYEILDNSTGLYSGVTQTVNQSTITAGVPVWVAGTAYNIGDVVLAGAQPGADPDCCYVLVYNHYNYNLHPSTYYGNYLNAINQGQQTLYQSAIWIPCDPKCADPVPLTGWECEPGFWDYSCLSKQIKWGDGVPTCCGDCPGGGGGWGAAIPGVGPGRCTAVDPEGVLILLSDPLNNTGTSHFCPDYNNSVNPIYNANMNFHQRKYEMPNTDGTPGGFNNVSGCCEGCNLLDDPNDFGGPDAGCLYSLYNFKVVNNVSYIDPTSASYCVQLTVNFASWTAFISALNTCGVYPAATPWDASAGANYNVSFPDVNTYLIGLNDWDSDWIEYNWDYCRCIDDPCYCYEVTGTTGTYATQSLCEQDCCQYYVCEKNLNTGVCDCVALPLGQVGPYPTLLDCQQDVTTCCSVGDCADCEGIFFQILIAQFSGVPYPNNFPQSQIGGPWGPTVDTTLTWSVGGSWERGDIVEDPIDGCCYYNNFPKPIHTTGSAASLNPFPPSECYSNWLLGRACDGSGMNNPTPVTLEQGNLGVGPAPLVINGPSVWWPCDETCPKPPEPSGSGHQCLQCCRDTDTGQVFQLALNTNPCVCPPDSVSVPFYYCGPDPSGSGEHPDPSGSGGVVKCEPADLFVQMHLNAGFPTTYAFCKSCTSDTTSATVQTAHDTKHCICCEDIPWSQAGIYHDPLNPYGWI